MTDKELVINTLKEHSCLTAQEIKGFIYRKTGDLISPQKIAGIARPFIAAGLIERGTSPVNNKTVYWLTPTGKAKWNEGG